MADVLAFAEVRDGQVGKAARETVTAARSLADDLGGSVHVVALGDDGTEASAATLGEFGADRVMVAEDASYGLYQPDAATAALVAAIGAADYAAVIFPASAQGRDLAPRVAGRLGRALASDVTAVSAEGGEVTVRRPMYAGKAIATLRFSSSPALMTVRANVFPAEARPGAGSVERVAPIDAPTRVLVTGFEASERDQLDVSEATTIVSGGRGLQDAGNWHLLEDLVGALGDDATLGASRAVVDAGWRPHSEQVGQTGKTVSPNLYFAIGISGAIQHLAGMRTAKVIVAINRDADAPIFNVADYGVVGDLFEIVPALTEEIRRVRQDG